MPDPSTASVSTDALAGDGPVDSEDRLRANTYSVLGNLLAKPPDAATLSLLERGPETDDDNLLTVAWRELAASAEHSTAGNVSDEYQALFIGMGRGELVPYASWYLTGFLMEQPLAKLRADMSQLGFELKDGIHEPEDHAAALCEIMALLGADDTPRPLEIQAAFFNAHIGPWMARFFRDMQTATSARFYRAVGRLGENFIGTDQRYLEMVDRTETSPPDPALQERR